MSRGLGLVGITLCMFTVAGTHTSAKTIVEPFTGPAGGGIGFASTVEVGGAGAIFLNEAGNPLGIAPSPGSGGTMAAHGGRANGSPTLIGFVGTLEFNVKPNSSGSVYCSFNVTGTPTGLSRYTAVVSPGSRSAQSVLDDIMADDVWNTFTVIGEYKNVGTGGVWVERSATINTGANNRITVALVWAAVLGSAPDGAWDDIALDEALLPGACANDIDNDGLCDENEMANNTVTAGKTNRILDDTDGDGLKDGNEDANRNGTVDPTETSPANRDTDGDRFEDGIEIAMGQNPLVQNPGYVDNDNDGHPDGTDPALNDKDADDDRYDDGYEVVYGNPTNATVKPHLGDVNGDTFVTSLDALIVQSLFLSLIDANNAVFDGTVAQDCFRFGDLNRDGNITSLDALITQSYFLNLLQTLPLR